MPASDNLEYINSTNYGVLETKLKELRDALEDLTNKSIASRKLRYADVDIEAEREEGRLQPDELYIPQHIIDTNIRREQSPYVQYVTQSPRAVICQDVMDKSVDLSLLENDLTTKIRYEGWQMELFAEIDGFQANGYGFMELVQDLNNPGELRYEAVQFEDFAFVADTRDIQASEMTGRAYYFTKTRLMALTGDPTIPKDSDFNLEQVEKVVKSDSNTANTSTEEYNAKDRSLYKIHKIMFRIKGVVNVAWACVDVCDDWLRKPRPLCIGRRKITPPQPSQGAVPGVMRPPVAQGASPQANLNGLGQPGQPSQPQQPLSTEDYETEYPYYLFPYLISENSTISNLKGRVFLDQDVQEAVTSLISSTVTKARRSAGSYFSKDVSDPNDDLLMQKNIFFRSGCLINSKVTQFTLEAPDPAMFSAIQMLVSGNQNETSQVNFAVQNRKDSRKTAKEIEVASNQAQVLSTVQVVLFSLALCRLYTTMTDIIRTRVQAGLIQVDPKVRPLYDRKITVKPSGDTDVIEKQQLIQTMMSVWSVVQGTGAANVFLADLLEKMFPDNAAKYLQAIQQAQQAQQQQQNSQLTQIMGMVKQMAQGIKKLAEHPEMFSDSGRVHAFPIIEATSEHIQQMEKALGVGDGASAGNKQLQHRN